MEMDFSRYCLLNHHTFLLEKKEGVSHILMYDDVVSAGCMNCIGDTFNYLHVSVLIKAKKPDW